MTAGSARPRLVFDGDCGLCLDLVAYGAAVSDGAVEFAPYQQVAEAHPEVSLEEFASTIVLFHPDGRQSRGARAAFEVLATGSGRGRWLWAWHRLPGFAPLSEAAYRWVARNRGWLAGPVRMLWGSPPQPAQFTRTLLWVSGLVALAFLIAFASLALQVEGLIGSRGIRSAEAFLLAVELGVDSPIWRLPTLFWLDASDTTLVGAAWTGVLISAFALATAIRGRTSTVAFLGCWVLMLSFVQVGDRFFSYQWDMLLLEAGLVCAFASRAPVLGIWCLRFLAARFMFLSGWVKLASGDPNWWSLDALLYHFETQPLPGPLAWEMHQLPAVLLSAGVLAMFVIELLGPLAVAAPRRLRALAGGSFIVLEVVILATGNYNFFNLLTIALAVSFFDDRVISGSARGPRPVPRAGVTGGRFARLATLAVLVLVTLGGALQTLRVITGRDFPTALHAPVAWIQRVRLASPYGVFAVMTTHRDELILEASLDGEHWQPYVPRYKPHDPAQRPRQVAPHQPRLDWQFWFASLTEPSGAPWINGLLFRLSQGSPAVEDLFEQLPFDGAPPRWFRVRKVRYAFTTPEQRAHSGNFWITRDMGLWMAPVQVRRAGGVE